LKPRKRLNPLNPEITMNGFGSWRRWRGVPLGGHLQRAARFCFSARDGEAKTSEIAEYSRPELVHRGGKPTDWQIHKHARALCSIGAKRVRREGPPRAERKKKPRPLEAWGFEVSP
jgi:hypothetical protein